MLPLEFYKMTSITSEIYFQTDKGISYWFEFQKTVFIYDANEKKTFSEVVYPTNWELSKYMEWKGYQEDQDIKNAEKHYGKNRFLFRTSDCSFAYSN